MTEMQTRRDFYERHGLLTKEPLGYFLSDANACWPEREMIAFNGVRYSYRAIWRWAMRVAHDLVTGGIGCGDRVLIQSANSVELLVLQFAVWRVGAICVPVLPIYRRHEVQAIVRDVRPRAIASGGAFRGRDLCHELDSICEQVQVVPQVKWLIENGSTGAGWELMAVMPGLQEEIFESGLGETSQAHECSVILFTSGTTSAPKGAMLSGEGILSQARSLARLYGISQAHDVVLCASPLAHTAALTYGILMPMAVGARTVLLPGWDPDQAIKVIADERATIMSAPVLFLYDLVERYEKCPQEIYRLPVFNSGGGVNPPSLIRRADAVGVKATRNYGMTETAGGCTMASPHDPLDLRACYDGRALFGAEVGIVDEERRPLPVGEVGEVRLRTPQLMLGYTDPGLTAAQIDAEKWFYTGDLGKLDAEGWLTITGRIKDIINRGGEKFSAHDIEAALTTHPAISEAAVVGAPDPRFGEVVAAFVKLHAGATWPDPEAVLQHLEAMQVARQKFPVQWHVVEEFPRTASGKVQKQKLRDLLTQADKQGAA